MLSWTPDDFKVQKLDKTILSKIFFYKGHLKIEIIALKKISEKQTRFYFLSKTDPNLEGIPSGFLNRSTKKAGLLPANFVEYLKQKIKK